MSHVWGFDPSILLCVGFYAMLHLPVLYRHNMAVMTEMHICLGHLHADVCDLELPSHGLPM